MPDKSSNNKTDQKQLSIDFNCPDRYCSKVGTSIESWHSHPEAKIVSMNNRKEVYQRILNRIVK